MIRESIEQGTDVWSSEYGHGTFHYWLRGADGIIAIIHFDGDNFNRAIKSRKLTELEQQKHMESTNAKLERTVPDKEIN